MSDKKFLMTPLKKYTQDVNAGLLVADSEQMIAVEHLDDLYRRLVEKKSLTFVSRIMLAVTKRESIPVKGLYLWGGVGRGKTYLMDLFFDALPFENKVRTHFHRFMRRVHHDLKTLKGVPDPLDVVAKKMASEARIICFDEFFVVDITDAMILANLLKALFGRGVTLVATSNIEPSGLYKEGLQRSRFLPAIALLESCTDIVNVDGGIDYRLRALQQAELYRYPLDGESKKHLESYFNTLTPKSEHVRNNVSLDVEGRVIVAIKECDDVVWFDFFQLCDGPRSQNDYIELAREYHTVLIYGVPEFDGTNDDQARRFIYLIDEFYDHSVKLIVAAAAPFQTIYKAGRLGFEFERTMSRLQEMQSQEYLARPHKP